MGAEVWAGAAGDHLNAAGVDSAFDEHRLAVEVISHDADHADVGEEVGGEGEMHRRPPERPVAATEWRLEGVVGDGSDGNEAIHTGNVPAGL